jgi:peptidoglycan/xylan/chitin deacetylase (PgdA/CDA1 family)
MKSRLLPVFAGVVLVFAPSGAVAQDVRERFRWPEGKRVAVSLSFDDARASQVDVGLALLDKYGAKATFYVNPGNLEKRLDGWKKVAANAHEIGNHTSSHPCTVNYPFSAKNAVENYTISMMEEELDKTNADIQRLLGIKPLTFAYPCGQKFVGRGPAVKSYVPSVASRFLVGRGFRDEGANDPVACDLAQVLGMESDGLTFEQMKSLVDDAATRRAWLVFAGHEIDKAGRQTTQTGALEQFLRFATDPANGIWLDTVQNVGKYIRARRSND